MKFSEWYEENVSPLPDRWYRHAVVEGCEHPDHPLLPLLWATWMKGVEVAGEVYIAQFTESQRLRHCIACNYGHFTEDLGVGRCTYNIPAYDKFEVDCFPRVNWDTSCAFYTPLPRLTLEDS